MPGLTDCDVLQAAVQQFYTDHAAPPEIHVPVPFPTADAELLENWLSERSERRVRIMVPRRGEKRGLLDLASRNAEVAYQARFNENVAANYDALETLRAVLALPSLPRRIECFDISTIHGSRCRPICPPNCPGITLPVRWTSFSGSTIAGGRLFCGGSSAPATAVRLG